MNATEALKKLREEGIRLKVGGLRLYVAGDMTPEQADLLQKYRREITGIVHAEHCLMLEALERSDAYESAKK
jgi:hypothetical protein